MDLFTDMNLEPEPIPAIHFNTTNLSGSELKKATRKATSQMALVLASMQRLKRGGPSDVYKELGGAFLLTSVRARMNTLTQCGELVKTTEKQESMNDALEYVWTLPKSKN
jgi:hypothetical protein